MFNNHPSTEYITRSGRRVRKPARYIPNGITSEALKDKNFEKINPHSIQGSRNRSEMIMDNLGNTCNSKKQDSLEIGDQAAADRVLEPTTVPAIDIQTPSLQNIPVEESWHFSFFNDSLYKPLPESKSTKLINVSDPDENDTYISNECIGSNDNVARKLFETTPEKRDYKMKNVCNGKDRTFLENWNSSHSVSQCNSSEDIYEISKTVPIPEISNHKASSDILLENLNSNSKFCSVSELGISNDNLEISKSLPVISTALTDEKNDIKLHDATSNSKSLKDISETSYVSENILSKKSSEVLSPKKETTFNGLEKDLPTYFSNLAIEPILDDNSFDLRNINAVTVLANDCILNKSNHCASFNNELLLNTDFKVSASKYDPTPEPGFSQNCFGTPVLVRSAKGSFIAAYIDPNSNSSSTMNKSIFNNNMDVLNSSIISAEEVDNGSEESLNDGSVFSYEESSEDIKQYIPDDEYVTKKERHSPKNVKQSFETFEKCTTPTQGDIRNSSAANDSEWVNGSISNYSFDTTVSSVFEENAMTANSSVTSEMKSETVKDTSASEPVNSVFPLKQFFDSNVSGLDIIKSELTDVENITVKDGSSNRDFNLNDKEHTSADLNNGTAKKEMVATKSKFSKANVDEFDTGVVVGIKEVDESLKLPLKKEARKNSFANETLSDLRTDDFKFQDKLESYKEKLTQIDRQDPIFSLSQNLDVLSKDSIVPMNMQVRDLLSQQKIISESEKEDIENILSPQVDFNASKLIDSKKNLYWSTRKSVSSPQLGHKKSEFASKIPELRRSITNISTRKVGNKFDYHAASKFTTSDLKVRRCDRLKSFLAESLCETALQRKGKSYAPVAAACVSKENINVVTPLKSHNSYNVRNCLPDLPKSAPRRCPKKFQNIQSPVAQYIKGHRVLGPLKTVKGHDTVNSTLPSHRSEAPGMSQILS